MTDVTPSDNEEFVYRRKRSCSISELIPCKKTLPGRTNEFAKNPHKRLRRLAQFTDFNFTVKTLYEHAEKNLRICNLLDEITLGIEKRAEFLYDDHPELLQLLKNFLDQVRTETRAEVHLFNSEVSQKARKAEEQRQMLIEDNKLQEETDKNMQTNATTETAKHKKLLLQTLLQQLKSSLNQLDNMKLDTEAKTQVVSALRDLKPLQFKPPKHSHVLTTLKKHLNYLNQLSKYIQLHTLSLQRSSKHQFCSMLPLIHCDPRLLLM